MRIEEREYCSYREWISIVFASLIIFILLFSSSILDYGISLYPEEVFFLALICFSPVVILSLQQSTNPRIGYLFLVNIVIILLGLAFLLVCLIFE